MEKLSLLIDELIQNAEILGATKQQEKAKTKEALVPLVIGMLISFGAYGIWEITMNVFYQII